MKCFQETEMESEKLSDLKSRAENLTAEYTARHDLVVDRWFADAVQYIRDQLHRLHRDRPFFLLHDEWAWIQKITSKKPTENYGARLLLQRWPLRLIREAEILESSGIPDHTQLTLGSGYSSTFEGYVLKVEQAPDGGISVVERGGSVVYKGRPAFRFERGVEPATSYFMLNAVDQVLRLMQNDTYDPALVLISLKWTKY
jgi:hypothetical protein